MAKTDTWRRTRDEIGRRRGKKCQTQTVVLNGPIFLPKEEATVRGRVESNNSTVRPQVGRVERYACERGGLQEGPLAKTKGGNRRASEEHDLSTNKKRAH